MDACLLSDRAIVSVTGADAEALLHRLVTNAMTGMAEGEARYAALLSPQGKLTFDFLVYRRADGFWLDVDAREAEALVRRLTMFRLRSQVTITRDSHLAVAAHWGQGAEPSPGTTFRDPRHPGLGERIVAPPEALAVYSNDQDDYERHRLALGVPKGGLDFVYGDTFVHDANLDLLRGVDFGKGCYVGQEVVSRVHHRHSARKRIAKLVYRGAAPAPGTRLSAGPLEIGAVTSARDGLGLALVRTDRLAEARTANEPVLAGDLPIEVIVPVPADNAHDDVA